MSIPFDWPRSPNWPRSPPIHRPRFPNWPRSPHHAKIECPGRLAAHRAPRPGIRATSPRQRGVETTTALTDSGTSGRHRHADRQPVSRLARTLRGPPPGQLAGRIPDESTHCAAQGVPNVAYGAALRQTSPGLTRIGARVRRAGRRATRRAVTQKGHLSAQSARVVAENAARVKLPAPLRSHHRPKREERRPASCPPRAASGTGRS